VLAIFLALTFQFKNASKPFIVFAAVPFGSIGAPLALWIMGTPFGFMGFLGVISLVGVIVSHIIVLFDFIEEKHAEGEPFEQAVLDAGIVRLRPVLITVGATVFGLFPLAAHVDRYGSLFATRRSAVLQSPPLLPYCWSRSSTPFVAGPEGREVGARSIGGTSGRGASRGRIGGLIRLARRSGPSSRRAVCGSFAPRNQGWTAPGTLSRLARHREDNHETVTVRSRLRMGITLLSVQETLE
jgi:hypothetical protein